MGTRRGSGSDAGRRARALAPALVLIGLVAGGCGGSGGGARAGDQDGVTVYTLELEPGTPIAGPLLMRGTFAIEDGCVVLHSEHRLANPVFVPDARLSADQSTIAVGDSTFPLGGGAATAFGGQVLDTEQARELGFEAHGNCSSHRFVFVYGDGA